MKKIDSGYDKLLGTHYELFKVKYSDLKALAKSWYDKDINFREFDERFIWDENEEIDRLLEMKKSGLLSNYFYAYKEGDKYYLMDGLNNL